MMSTFAFGIQIDLSSSNSPLCWINTDGTLIPFTLLDPPSELVNIAFITSTPSFLCYSSFFIMLEAIPRRF